MADYRGVHVIHDAPAAMRDGVVLRADIYRPESEGAFPVLLQRTPYNKRFAQSAVYQHPAWYARQGYIVAVQDVRGRFASDGDFVPYLHEAEDGYDSIGWAASLPGSSGKVGTYGFSYAGACQILAAACSPSNLAATAIGMAGTSFNDGWTYRGGALQLAFILSWTIQALAPPQAIRSGQDRLMERLRELGANLNDAYRRPLGSWIDSGELPAFFEDWVRQEGAGEYWERLSRPMPSGKPVPNLYIGGWYDIFLSGTLAAYSASAHSLTRGRSPEQRLVVGPWQHVPWASLNGSVSYGSSGNNNADSLQLSWFDKHLKGKSQTEAQSPVSYFLMGANEWRRCEQWPPEGARTTEYFLRSDGRANSLSGTGTLSEIAPVSEPPDLYVYDPSEPVPSVGGASCCRADVAPVGAFDQRHVEIRNDVLVYTSPVLDKDVDVVGPVELVIFAATDAPDTDWTAKLVDVHPDGKAINICDGIIRARFRNPAEPPSNIEPGQIYEYRIDLGATANRFLRGHAIRLEVSSSNFPAYDVNDNTGATITSRNPNKVRIATQAVFHDAERCSRLRLSLLGPAKSETTTTKQ
ncbi:MAG: CocE/NonD family hydrolase [Rhizobiaceae bacterium]|nr:CocE/NonD family hydrolase [Rhizobiaceae bacterium]